MDFNINDVSGAPISKFTFGLIACLGCSYNVSTASHNGSITTGAYVLVAMTFLLLLVWLIWLLKMFLSGKKVIHINQEAGKVVQVINWIILDLWICSDFFWQSSPAWVICVWSLFAISALYYAIYCHKHGWEE